MRPFLLSAVLAFIADQASKYYVIHLMNLPLVNTIPVLPPLLTFRYGENRGINFGLGDGLGPWFLIAVAVIICVAVTIWLIRRPQPLLIRISAGLLVGGALGNVLDRVLYGYVLDFLNMSCCGINNPFVFNVADIAIFAGAIGIAFLAGDDTKKKPAKGENDA
ncbi:signal peptidase II [Aestuariibius sp. 2305UL40-4]|uniref:signal peptidase II n=1 Tax=Aestuariibius violaceus TaxID=3234132 RepID=UPI00345E322B